MESNSDLVKASSGPYPERAVQAASLRNFDRDRGIEALRQYGYNSDSDLYREYIHLASIKDFNNKDIPSKKKATFTAKFILQTFEVLKLNETQVFYIGHMSNPLFHKCNLWRS